jgi:hypothetical protein
VASRGLSITLRTIPDEKRLSEVDVRDQFGKIAPAVFGTLLTALSKAMERLPSLQLPVLPRMADFAKLACAAAPVFGWTEDEVLATIMDSRIAGTRAVLEGDPLAEMVAKLVAKADWSGTATQLLRALAKLAPPPLRRSKSWPKDATRLAGRLRRLATALRNVGILIDLDREGHDRRRAINIRFADRAKTPSAASAASTAEKKAAETEACEAKHAAADADGMFPRDPPASAGILRERSACEADATAGPEVAPPEAGDRGSSARGDDAGNLASSRAEANSSSATCRERPNFANNAEALWGSEGKSASAGTLRERPACGPTPEAGEGGADASGRCDRQHSTFRERPASGQALAADANLALSAELRETPNQLDQEEASPDPDVGYL